MLHIKVKGITRCLCTFCAHVFLICDAQHELSENMDGARRKLIKGMYSSPTIRYSSIASGNRLFFFFIQKKRVKKFLRKEKDEKKTLA